MQVKKGKKSKDRNKVVLEPFTAMRVIKLAKQMGISKEQLVVAFFKRKCGL